MMKNFRFIFGLLVVLFCASSCFMLGDDDDTSLEDLPTTIQDYILDNYPDYEVDEAELESLCTDEEVYKVELEGSGDNEIELAFDLEENFLYESVEIPSEELPTAVQERIDTDYEGFELEYANQLILATDGVQYQVEIEKGKDELYVLFNGNGTVICEGDDD